MRQGTHRLAAAERGVSAAGSARRAAVSSAAASASLKLFGRTLAFLPSLIVRPAAGLLGSLRLLTAQPKTRLNAARPPSFKVLAETARPALGASWRGDDP